MSGPKRGYSRKIKVLGYGIILLEAGTVVVFLLAVYSMAITGVSLSQSVYSNYSNGKTFGLQNVTTNGQVQQAFVLPGVTNRGFFPVSLSITAVFLNAYHQAYGAPYTDSVTVAAGQSRDFVIPVTSLVAANNANGVRVSFEVSSIFGLVGIGGTATVTK